MRRRSREGQGTVEFALVAIIMFGVFCAIVELSWWFYNLIYLNNAVNKAARAYVKSTRSGNEAQVALTAERGGLPVSTSTITVMNSSFVVITTTPTAGCYVKVDATVLYPSVSPLNNFIQWAGLGTIRSQCIMRIE